MKKEIVLYAVEVSPHSTPEDEYGGDMERIGTLTSVKAALAKAKKESMKETYYGKPLHEIWVEQVEDGDVVEQWSFQKGKVVFHTCPS